VTMQRECAIALALQVIGKLRACCLGIAERQGGFRLEMAEQPGGSLEPAIFVDLVEMLLYLAVAMQSLDLHHQGMVEQPIRIFANGVGIGGGKKQRLALDGAYI